MWPFGRRRNRSVRASRQCESWYAYHTRKGDGWQLALSFLPPEDAQRLGGLHSEAILGTIECEGPPPAQCGPDQFDPNKFDPDRFRPNPHFVDFLHDFLKQMCPQTPELQALAAKMRTGTIGVIDLRTPEGILGNVPLEDTVGMFAVVDGKITAQTYHPVDKYLLYSRHGIMRLPPPLDGLLISAVKATYAAKDHETTTVSLSP